MELVQRGSRSNQGEIPTSGRQDVTTKVRSEPPVTGWSSDHLRSAIDAVLAQGEALLRSARSRVRPTKTVIDVDEATMATVALAPGLPVIKMPDEDVERILEADTRAGLR